MKQRKQLRRRHMQGKDEILDIVDLFVKTNQRNLVSVNTLKNVNFRLMPNNYNPEEKIINKIDFSGMKNHSLKVGAVDSGFVSKQLNFASITIIKEVGVVFNYKDGVLDSTKYFPKTYNLARPYLTTSALEIEEIVWNTAILRLNKEIDLLLSILEKEKMDFLLMDGSIIPQYLTKPAKESKLLPDYLDLLGKFNRLYRLAKEKKCVLVGCIEDSRANRFFSYLKDELLVERKMDFDLYDNFVVSSLLEVNERTGVMKYTKNMNEHPVLKDFPSNVADNLYVCYCKLSKDDFPLRFEFIYPGNKDGDEDKAKSLTKYTNDIANNIGYLSSFNRKYIYPAPLIEVDIRSRLKMSEIDTIMVNILEKTRQFGVRLPRRESRIF